MKFQVPKQSAERVAWWLSVFVNLVRICWNLASKRKWPSYWREYANVNAPSPITGWLCHNLHWRDSRQTSLQFHAYVIRNTRKYVGKANRWWQTSRSTLRRCAVDRSPNSREILLSFRATTESAVNFAVKTGPSYVASGNYVSIFVAVESRVQLAEFRNCRGQIDRKLQQDLQHGQSTGIADDINILMISTWQRC